MVYVMLADGFEEIEALTVVDVLRRAGIETHSVSITHSNEVVGAHGITVVADDLFTDVNLATCELVVLPGGMPGATNLRADESLCAVLKERAEKDLPIAAICAAPFILGELGILKGRHATCYPGFETKLKGAYFSGESVERDRNLITANGPAAAMNFALAIVDLIADRDKAIEVSEGMLCNK